MGARLFRTARTNVGAIVGAAVLCSGCLSSGGDSTNALTGDEPPTPPPPAGNSAPSISGTPPVSATVGEAYSFTPTASDPDGDTLEFRIQNQPQWADFDSATGRLSGVPQLGSVGMHDQVRISVSDGQASSSLPNFGIEVLGRDVPTEFSVLGTQPSAETPADIGTIVRVTFSSDIDPASVTSDTLSITDRNGEVSGTVAVDGSVLVFTPDNALSTGMLHSAQVSSSVRAAGGDSLNSAFGWSFSTSFGDAIPELASFEATIFEHGPRWGEYMNPSGPNSQDDKFFHEFYSAANSFQQISEYLGTPEPWLTYADWSNEVYRTYLVATGYTTQGLRRFTHGMFGEHVRGDDVTLEELQMLRDNPAYSRVSELTDQGGAENRSRPIALAVMANIHAEQAGSSRMMEGGAPRLESFVRFMGSHLYEWRTGDYRGDPTVGIPRFAPFMFALTANSLINFIEWERQNGRDENAYWQGSYPIDYGRGVTSSAQSVNWPTIVDAMKDVAEWAVLEAHHDTGENVPMWNPDSDGYASFVYETSGEVNIRPGLNLMIAPVYAWLWKETGDRRFRDWADQLFGAGSLNSVNAAGRGGKQFNQHFLYSFDYMKWRAEGDAQWLDN